MKLSDELIELRRKAQIEKIEAIHPEYFTNLRNELKYYAENCQTTFHVTIESLPKDVSMTHIQEWSELNGMDFDWESVRYPFRICF
jgi:hypothetical protein